MNRYTEWYISKYMKPVQNIEDVIGLPDSEIMLTGTEKM